jgi:hypothetical protein
MIWIISTILWYEGLNKPQQSDYLLKTFENKLECQIYIQENKVFLIEQLFEEMKNVDGFKLKTFEYLCKKESLTEV